MWLTRSAAGFSFCRHVSVVGYYLAFFLSLNNILFACLFIYLIIKAAGRSQEDATGGVRGRHAQKPQNTVAGLSLLLFLLQS